MLNSNFGEKKIAAMQHHSCPLVFAEQRRRFQVIL